MFQILCSWLLLVGPNSLSAELDWWETSVIYQIFPWSFKDSNGDGIGDLNGIYEKLDYIKDLGVDVVWIQPVYRSPMIDMGYDPISMREIDPIFGTLDDMKRLIQGAHERDLKVLMDFVPNHTSNESEWFKRSVEREEPYTDYFIWHDGRPVNNTHRVEPNNWISQFTDHSAWTWNDKRQQYYFHHFSEEQPDLNLRNPKVQGELESLLRFWLDLGADGFRVDAVPYFFEAAHLRDEPEINDTDISSNFYKRLHIYTMRQPENLQILQSWREFLDSYKKKDGITRLLAVEDTGPMEGIIPLFGNESHPAAHFPFNYGLLYLDYTMNVTVLDKTIHDLVDQLPINRLPNWMTESHDLWRISSRFGTDAVDSFNMLNLLLPGSACVYYGSEIGLEESMVRKDQSTKNTAFAVLPLNRDIIRGPMPWDDTKNGGFTTAKKPWLPLSSRYWLENVKKQVQEPKSHLNIFKRLAALRKTPIGRYGDLKTHVVNTWTYLFTRSANNHTIAVVINLGSESEKICSEDSNFGLPEIMFVHTGSLNSGFEAGEKIRVVSSKVQSCAELRPKAGLVMTTYRSNGMVWSLALWHLLLGIGVSTLWQSGIY
ncbi:unnamed protein product [Bemisia tabaci]|uniref:alpha-glucosidase n=1 Tax=Bemisia tabaci TaxID=7038 RepID=A0A9P0AMG8_BEMTA|nr:unnamed protein product [Bemisia tabaci]